MYFHRDARKEIGACAVIDSIQRIFTKPGYSAITASLLITIPLGFISILFIASPINAENIESSALPAVSASNGSDDPGSNFNLGVDFRVFDTKNISGHLGYQRGILHDQNLGYAVLGFAIGESYQDKEIKRLQARLEALERIPKPSKEPEVEEKPVRGIIRGR